MRPFWKRSPTEEKQDASDRNVISMLTTVGESYYAWNGKMYESDIIRACIRPKVKANRLTGQSGCQHSLCPVGAESVHDRAADAGKSCQSALPE